MRPKSTSGIFCLGYTVLGFSTIWSWQNCKLALAFNTSWHWHWHLSQVGIGIYHKLALAFITSWHWHLSPIDIGIRRSNEDESSWLTRRRKFSVDTAFCGRYICQPTSTAVHTNQNILAHNNFITLHYYHRKLSDIDQLQGTYSSCSWKKLLWNQDLARMPR